MKVLSLTRPWAMLVALEEKRIETRSWMTRYRGPIATHASKAFPRKCRDLCNTRPFRAVLWKYGLKAEHLPCGAILCETSIDDCMPTDQIIAAADLYCNCRHEIEFGDYGAGRFGFLLGRVILYEAPIIVDGELGLWNWTEYPI